MPLPSCLPTRPLLFPPLFAALLMLSAGCGPAVPVRTKAESARAPFPETELRTYLLPRLGGPFAEPGSGGEVKLTFEAQPAGAAEPGALRVAFRVEHTQGVDLYVPANLTAPMLALAGGSGPESVFRSALERLERVPGPVGARLRARLSLAGIDAGAGSTDVFTTNLADDPPPAPTRTLPTGPALLARTAARGQKVVAYGACLARRTIDTWTFDDVALARVDGDSPRGYRREEFPAAGYLTLNSAEGATYVRAQAEARQRVVAEVSTMLGDLHRRLEARLRALEADAAQAYPLRGQFSRPQFGTSQLRVAPWRLSLHPGVVGRGGVVAVSGELDEGSTGVMAVEGDLREGVLEVHEARVLRPGPDSFGEFRASQAITFLLTLEEADEADAPLAVTAAPTPGGNPPAGGGAVGALPPSPPSSPAAATASRPHPARLVGAWAKEPTYRLSFDLPPTPR